VIGWGDALGHAIMHHASTIPQTLSVVVVVPYNSLSQVTGESLDPQPVFSFQVVLILFIYFLETSTAPTAGICVDLTQITLLLFLFFK
jgi:hypothetical protein